MSQIRSRIEYLILTDNILVLFYAQIISKHLALLTGFQYDVFIYN